jgi:DNA mismatch repair ATPase MutS
MVNFFVALRDELAFYLGALNLHRQLTDAGMPTCLPTLTDEPGLSARDLYDPGLLLRTHRPVVGNDVDATGRSALVVTGANQGGKSTFLRSVGLAQLMTQAGTYVAATAYTTGVRSGVFTHFRRQEDEALVSGKFDEELTRLSSIVDAVAPGGLVLMNESFAATNESEGAEIGGTVVRAVLDAGVAALLVTHSFELAERLRAEADGQVLFLRAERRDDGQRTYLMLPGHPEPTSFAIDLYDQIMTGRLPAER